MIRISAGLAAVAFAVAGCGQKADAPASTTPAAADKGQYKTDIAMKELMAHVIDNAADGVWLAQGWLIDSEGTHELFPTDDAGWRYATNAGITIAEASNLLLLPGRPVDDDPRWVDAAHMMYDAGMEAFAAAEARDKERFFDAGGKIYEACTKCHSHYVIGND
jgi:hypothetical protein